MENSLFTNKLFLSGAPSFFFGITNIVLVAVFILVSAVLFLVFTITYKKIRCKFPVRVNCWFCNNCTKVPYNFSNSWECPHCKQYNGFDKNGDYNKIIEEQYNTKLNEDNFNILKKSVYNNKKNNFQSNGFCKLCNINQQLKIQQLALFVPLNEKNYYDEIEQYREKLEKAYHLCSICEKTLKETLEKQEYNLLKNRLNEQKLNFTEPKKGPSVYSYSFHNLLCKMKGIGVKGSRWTCILISLLLFFASITHFETELQFSHLVLLQYVTLERFQFIMEVVFTHFANAHKFRREFSFFGVICCILSNSPRQGKIGQTNLFIWVLVHILSWSNLTGLQVLLCGISVFLNGHFIRNKQIYLRKKLLRQNCSFQPEKLVFPETYGLPEENSLSVNKKTQSAAMENFGSSADSSDLIESRKLQEIKTKPSFSGESKFRSKKKGKNKENEMEYVPDEDREETHINPDHLSPNVKTNSSIFSKSFLSSLENDKPKEETTGPLDEVYNNLGCLHLGGKRKKSYKPSNYLFASHNFSEKKNFTSSSVIKPAKLIRNLSNSWTGTESNESASRSSTPSSGYSSQKVYKMEPNRYDFPKTMTPLSVNPYNRSSPRECFDYYDGNGSFYNNFNCFPQGFVPFQQFSSPLSHTTVYTYSRPSNFPFPFPPPSQGFPSNYKYSPASTRFSDSSDCDNLFQNTSKTFENNKKWFKLKTISYYFSIFLNLITLLGFVSFFSAGIISVDWKLPKFNFFL